ncbi:hypothetical protein A9Q81_17845 [Gammaproteobacteria bacterium 42_54_T18]|nr:hypothetical protein A9Q81_17845 [Gammaproteobacteria bacterium 42_54_T18]
MNISAASSSPLLTDNNTRPPNPSSSPASITGQPPEDALARSVSVSPNADNVNEGDRSQNAVTVTISGSAEQQDTYEVTREQFFGSLETTLGRRNAQQFVDASQQSSGENTQASSLVRKSVISAGLESEGSDVTREAAFSILDTKRRYSTAQYALDQFGASSESNSNSNESSNSTEFEDIARNAVQIQNKNAILDVYAGNQDDTVGSVIDTSE